MLPPRVNANITYGRQNFKVYKLILLPAAWELVPQPSQGGWRDGRRWWGRRGGWRRRRGWWGRGWRWWSSCLKPQLAFRPAALNWHKVDCRALLIIVGCWMAMIILMETMSVLNQNILFDWEGTWPIFGTEYLSRSLSTVLSGNCWLKEYSASWMKVSVTFDLNTITRSLSFYLTTLWSLNKGEWYLNKFGWYFNKGVWYLNKSEGGNGRKVGQVGVVKRSCIEIKCYEMCFFLWISSNDMTLA